MLRFAKNIKSFNWHYALGEVVLIFVGITLAIWFDAWSADRADKNKRDRYLTDLKQDLQKDINEYDSLLLANNTRIQHINSLNRHLHKPSPNTSCDSIQRFVLSTCFVNVFTGSSTVIEDLKSTGNLSLLKDISIKNSLLAYYAHTQSRKQYEELNTNFHIQTSGAFLYEYWNVGSMLRLGLGETGLSRHFIETDCEKTMEVLEKIRLSPGEAQRMMNMAGFSYFLTTMNNEEYQFLRKEAFALIEAMEKL